MSKQREELDSALEALQNEMRETISRLDPDEMVNIFPPCKPVAWMLMNDTHCHIMATDWKPEDSDEYKTVPLYAAPAARKPLTEEQINTLWVNQGKSKISFARAIERAHGIKPTEENT